MVPGESREPPKSHNQGNPIILRITVQTTSRAIFLDEPCDFLLMQVPGPAEWSGVINRVRDRQIRMYGESQPSQPHIAPAGRLVHEGDLPFPISAIDLGRVAGE